MELSFRRVETGHDARGRAVIRSDGAPLRTVRAPNGTEVSELLWLDHGARHVDDGRDRDDTGFPLEPPPGGASFRILKLPSLPRGGVDDGWLRVNGDDPARPGMHATDTLDYVCVIEGEVELGLDDGEHRLGPGDVVIQRGTAHRWRVIGDRACTYAVLMLRPDPAARSAVPLAPRIGAAAGGRMRRLVTASDRHGRSRVESFAAPAVVFEPGGADGVSLLDFWQSGGPVRTADQGGDAPGWELDPIGAGVCCRSPQLPGGMDPGDRGWHATDTIDLNIVLRGRLQLNLPEGLSTVIEPGETVLQRGTNHQWQPVGTEPVSWFAIMFGLNG